MFDNFDLYVSCEEYYDNHFNSYMYYLTDENRLKEYEYNVPEGE